MWRRVRLTGCASPPLQECLRLLMPGSRLGEPVSPSPELPQSCEHDAMASARSRRLTSQLTIDTRSFPLTLQMIHGSR
jgi:hypothetical protein